MENFIKVTDPDTGYDVWINIDAIKYFTTREGEDNAIICIGDDCFDTKETVEEICELIRNASRIKEVK